MKIQKIDITPEKVLNLLRGNFVLIIIAGIIAFLLDYRNAFKGPDEFYYNILSGLVSLLILIIIKKYRYPFSYSPNHIFFVKDRSDPMIRLEPLLDPIITTLGLIRYGDFVNIRYRLYPDLPTGVDLNPNTGLISGFPMEVGNHTSEVKMRFLGGEYSTNIRIEVVNTLKEKMVVPERDEFAPPRTVAQLLLREEDVLKREQDLEYSLAQEREAFEREYHIKELSLKSDFDSEKSKLSKELADVRRTFEGQLTQKNLEFATLSSDMKDKLEKLDQEKNNKIEELDQERNSKIEELNQERINQVEKIESEMVSALQDKEREFNEFEKEIKSKFEAKERELEENYKVEKVVEEVPIEEEPEEEVVEEVPIEEEPEEEEYDYVSMTKAELVELAKKRNISTSGTKKKILSRLEDND